MDNNKSKKLVVFMKKTSFISVLLLIMMITLSSCSQSTDSPKLAMQALSLNSSGILQVDGEEENVNEEVLIGEPEIEIITPLNGSQLQPDQIVIAIKANNFDISRENLGLTNREGQGHFIYYLDENPPTKQGEPAFTNTSMVSTNLYHLWKGVSEGKHTLYVQLVNNDYTPLAVPVIVSVDINVKLNK